MVKIYEATEMNVTMTEVKTASSKQPSACCSLSFRCQK